MATKSNANVWTEEGERLALSLEGIEDESKIRVLCEEVVRKINDRYSNPASRKNPQAAVRKPIEAKYPSDHSALKYLTVSEQKRDKLNKKSQEQVKTKPKAKGKSESTKQATEQPTKKLLDMMTIQDLELDAETQTILEDAIARSGLSLPDFLKQSVRVYAKTITGKARQLGEDLANVPTEKLLKDAAYSTHPGRAEELVKRAIRAIKTYNDEVATEPKQRWIITPSLLNQLTGSRVAKINEILANCKDEIDSYHAKYPDFFEEDGTLKQYFNRKRGVDVEDEINLIERVPYGWQE